MPVNAFADPAFDMNILNSTAMFTTEAILDTASQVLSTEAVNALEEKYGEFWYANMLQMTVSNAINSATNVLGDMLKEKIIENQQAKYIKDYDGNITKKIGPEEVVADKVTDDGSGGVIATWADEDFSVYYDTEGNLYKETYNQGLSFGYGKGDLDVFYENGYQADWGFDLNWLDYWYGEQIGDRIVDEL
jgi:hypothetical protein